MIINHNIGALSTYNRLQNNNLQMSKSMEKLSSGMRINRGADDAAGLAISDKMRGQIRGLEQAQRNSQDAISLIQTADGALGETTEVLQRMRELAVQANNGTYTSADRKKISDEMVQMSQAISKIASTTEFNSMKLLKSGVSLQFQVGANTAQNLKLTINKMAGTDLGVASGSVQVSAVGTASTVLKAINSAIKKVSDERAHLGAYQNRLEYTISNLNTASENLTAAESRIRDVDMAKEVMKNSKNNILAQAAQSMLAQANQQPQQVLQLLR